VDEIGAATPTPPRPKTGPKMDSARTPPSRRQPSGIQRRPTMADVAVHAGVSSTTVSFVINDRPNTGISDHTRARVLAAVAELGFRPNQQARSLALRRSRTIGFVGYEMAAAPYAGRTISGAHDIARHNGSLLLIAHTTSDVRQVRQAIDELLERQVDSIVFAVIGTRRVNVPSEVGKTATILVNCYSTHDLAPSLLPDEEAGGRDAARMLLAAGHRRIAYLAGLPGSWATRRRLKGFRSELMSAGIAEDEITVLFGDFHTESGYDLARSVLSGKDIPTALFCGNDRMALGVYFAILERGLSIPGDISVVGYDDQEELAEAMHPPLATIRLPYYEMGRLAVEHLVAGDLDSMPSRTYVACPPVLRASVGPPRTRAVR
jgi:LacI family transcriptional regulator